MPLNRRALREVVVVFLRLGATAFGGPAAHVAMQEDECVRRRGWLDRARFLDLLAATHLIPGPSSTEMAMHLGRLRAGWPGLVAGGVAFILPSAVLVTLAAAVYARAGALPSVELVLATLRPAVAVVIADVAIRFARQAFHTAGLGVAGALALAGSLAGVGEVTLVVAAAVAGVLIAHRAPGRLRTVPLLELALVSAKIGATLFGSGYVLVAYLRTELGARGWLSDGVLLDAIAIGQVTPGPISTAVTFVGYLLAGVPGATVATAALFLPGFLFVAATAPLVDRWREHPVVRRTLDVVNAAVVGLIVAVIVRLAPAALASEAQLVVAAAAATALWGFGISPTLVLGASTLAGVARAIVMP